MRLLNVNTLRLESFISNPPPYAILSHTWGSEEVTFEQLNTAETEGKSGYRKILQTCDQAKKDDYAYVWIDTCCIDKRSSSELSESINAMFRWYRESQVCYV